MDEAAPSLRRRAVGQASAGTLAGSTRTTTAFETGVLLISEALASGMSTFASGKYAAAHPLAVGYDTTRKSRNSRSGSSRHSLKISTFWPSTNPSSTRSSGLMKMTLRPCLMPR